MPFRLELRFDSPVQLQAHLLRYVEQGGVIIPERLCPGLALPEVIELEFAVEGGRAVARGQALRRDRLGVVVELSRAALDDAFSLLPPDLPRESAITGRTVALGRLGGTAGRAAQGAVVQERVRPSAEAPGRDAMPGLPGPLAQALATIDAGDLPPATITPVGPVLLADEDLSQRTPLQRWDEAEEEWAEEPATQGVPPPPEAAPESAESTDAPSAQTTPDPLPEVVIAASATTLPPEPDRGHETPAD